MGNGDLQSTESATPESRERRIRSLSEEDLLRLALGRRDGSNADRATAEEAWVELVTRNVDRIRAWVVLFRHPAAPDVRISRDDVDDVAQKAWDRATRCMLRTFDGSELPVFRAALRTCASNTCKDWCRAELTREKRQARSLDEPVDDPEGGDGMGRYEHEIAKMSRQGEAEADQIRARNAALTEAIDKLESEGQRVVIAETRAGYSSKEIAERHGWTVAAVDKHRSRGLRKLEQDSELRKSAGYA